MALALFMLTLFRRGRIIHETTYFDNTGQQSPVHDVANILQYDSGMAFMAHSQCWPCKRPSWVAFSTARCTALSQTDACCQQTNLVRIIYRCPATAVTVNKVVSSLKSTMWLSNMSSCHPSWAKSYWLSSSCCDLPADA